MGNVKMLSPRVSESLVSLVSKSLMSIVSESVVLVVTVLPCVVDTENEVVVVGLLVVVKFGGVGPTEIFKHVAAGIITGNIGLPYMSIDNPWKQ